MTINYINCILEISPSSENEEEVTVNSGQIMDKDIIFHNLLFFIILFYL